MSKKSGIMSSCFSPMYKIFDINIHEMLSIEMVEPDSSHSPIILAIVPMEINQIRPMVLYWNDETQSWIDERGYARSFTLWTYISVEMRENEDGNKNI